MVKSFARTIKVTEDPALRAELREHLRTVWPEVLGALKDAGVLKSKIFLSGSRLKNDERDDRDYDYSQIIIITTATPHTNNNELAFTIFFYGSTTVRTAYSTLISCTVPGTVHCTVLYSR